MTRGMLVVACLSLSPCWTGCAARATRPPVAIEVPVPARLPAWCLQLEPVTLPPGSTSEDVEREQHRALLAYEGRLVACRELVAAPAGAPAAPARR